MGPLTNLGTSTFDPRADASWHDVCLSLFQRFSRCSPQGKNKKGGEIMMMITIIISALSMTAMLAGFVVMVRD
jgi:hypothetical protein